MPGLPRINYRYQQISPEEVSRHLTSGNFTEIPVRQEDSDIPGHPRILASGEIPVSSDTSNNWTAYLRVEEGFILTTFPAGYGGQHLLFFSLEGCPGGSESCEVARDASWAAASRAAGSLRVTELPGFLIGEEEFVEITGFHDLIGPDRHMSRVLVGDANGDGFNDVLVILSHSRVGAPDGQGILFLGGSCLFPARPERPRAE